ncbi:hypothetical protein J3A64_001739 [Pseudarthrobacter sp. PvP004]|uniref:DUF5677 domain-containing protein n=1 Tax=Pseudarthrobacter sp. PvP004 TaxID=2817850 RepID=UPI001AEB4578|nr:DUF5677 domain-containing protein [Pseudarthrobacter sp. PvP004]MBP2266275.1 hypothetical protein [Pseudarthrobacter sp. PvP004]
MNKERNTGDNEDRILLDIQNAIDRSPAPGPRPVTDLNRDELASVRTVDIAWGWLMRTLRSIEAIRILEKQGYGAECPPLRRSAVEHVLRLIWAAEVSNRDFVEGALNDRKHNMNKVLRLGRLGTPLPDDFVENIRQLQDEADPESKKSFSNLTDLPAIVPQKHHDLFKIWVTETQETHPSIDSSSAYVQFHPDGRGTSLLTEPRQRDRQDALLPYLALTAATAYIRIVGIVEPLQDEFEALQERIFLLSSPR